MVWAGVMDRSMLANQLVVRAVLNVGLGNSGRVRLGIRQRREDRKGRAVIGGWPFP